jgi:hypothetical protein
LADQEVTEALSLAMVQLITGRAFDALKPSEQRYHEFPKYQLGWDGEVRLAAPVIEELQRRGLAQPVDDASVELHPVVLSTVLVLISQLALSAGRRQGLDLHPVTADRSAIGALIQTLSLSSMPSVGRIVGLDLEMVAPNLAPVPLDEILDFRRQHGQDFQRYSRSLRRFIAEVSASPADGRERLLLDRREELADTADELRRTGRRAWRRPLANVSLGAVGAVLSDTQGSAPAALAALGGGLLGTALPDAEVGAYSYLFAAQRELIRSVRSA